MAVGATANPKYAGIVIDAKTGKTLYANSADSLRYPASLTKMMTLYMVFEALDNGSLSKKTRISISRNAANEQPSKIGLRPGQTISVEQGIYALVTKSANDVATALGEHIGGSESGFARKMTAKARALGMKSTTPEDNSAGYGAAGFGAARTFPTLLQLFFNPLFQIWQSQIWKSQPVAWRGQGC